MDGTKAKEVLREGDKILNIEGNKIETWEDLTKILQNNRKEVRKTKFTENKKTKNEQKMERQVYKEQFLITKKYYILQSNGEKLKVYLLLHFGFHKF